MEVFSKVSQNYRKYRPTYPKSLIEKVISVLNGHTYAWDVATGTGQFASLLSSTFEKVYASDGSIEQIRSAVENPNIVYFHHVIPSEDNLPFKQKSLDLITVSQAFHWFHPKVEETLELFQKYLQPKGILAIIGYQRPQFVNNEIDILFENLYSNIFKPYWKPDHIRKWLESEYAEVTFKGFHDLGIYRYHSETSQNWEEFSGYVKTWSCYNYAKEDKNPEPDQALLQIQSLFGKRQELIIPSFVRLFTVVESQKQ